MQSLSTNQIFLNASFSKEEFKKTYLAAIEAKFGKKQETIVSYPGGKLKMKKELNEIFTEMAETNKFTTYIDGFFGMGGSFKALSDALLEHQVKEIIVNDINKCIVIMHKCIRDYADEMIEYYLERIRCDIVMSYQKLFIVAEDLIIVKKKWIAEFEAFQKDKKFGIETSTLFIMLCAFNFSGVVQMNKKGDIKFTQRLYCVGDLKNFLFNTMSRIRTFNELYNKFDMKFYSNDYFALFQNYQYKTNTIWNIDTVYLKEDYSEYIKSDMENIKNSSIVGCSCNYGQDDFDHIGVLETLKNINFIYNNNTHPLIYHYIEKLKLKHKKFTRHEAISSSIKENAKAIQELIVYGNNFKYASTNQPDYAPKKAA
ncbi:MAG: hypothetical protein C0627_08880 [Sulfurimonas sp.]|nr:MAG: hypothetical protein C0627_08880 [Sulfurimonas sp.]